MANELRIYLRRDRLDANQDVVETRLLYLPLEAIPGSFNVSAITPKIPGNDAEVLMGGSRDYNGDAADEADELAGTTQSSNNILINIGKQHLGFTCRGTIQPLDAEDFPDLPSTLGEGLDPPVATDTDNIIYEHVAFKNKIDATALDETIATDFTARELRQLLLEWTADQASDQTITVGNTKTGWTNWRLGYGNWLKDGVTQEFHGMILGDISFEENVGLPDQYPFSFQFAVGDSFDILSTAVGF